MISPDRVLEKTRPRLIVALDVVDRSSALQCVDRLSGQVGCFKVGLELFTREGPALVQEIRARGERVFLDLKLHDIPNTVAGAVRAACRLDVQMLTVHAVGGLRMLEAAVAAALESPRPPLLLAVTALTSLSDEEARRLGVTVPLSSWVELLAGRAVSAGVRGIVASSLEAGRLRRIWGDALRLVVPGIRPAGSEAQDQARIATPAEAIRQGADFVVVGRPILQAADPVLAARNILLELNEAAHAAEHVAAPGSDPE